jgi:DNA-binding beta-propeller fold protein YncE
VTTVPRANLRRPLLALAAALAATGARAQTPVFVHSTSIYEDEKAKAFKEPEGVACGENGLVVVADSGNGRLVRLKFANGAVSGGTEVRVAELPYPIRVQLDAKGNALVLDGKVRRIGRVDAGGAFGGYLEVKGVAAPNAVLPAAFKLDIASGTVVLLDAAALRVLVLDASGSVTRQLDLPRPPAFFKDVASDATGAIYALDAVGGAVWVARRGETAFTVLAKGLKESSSFPTYLTVSRGRLFVVDQNGSGLLALGPDGSFQGRQLSIGWSDGFVYYPSQLCIGTQGEAVLADRGNNRVQIFSAAK